VIEVPFSKFERDRNFYVLAGTWKHVASGYKFYENPRNMSVIVIDKNKFLYNKNMEKTFLKEAAVLADKLDTLADEVESFVDHFAGLAETLDPAQKQLLVKIQNLVDTYVPMVDKVRETLDDLAK
jgi:hypothetical protein